ncbi:MAG: glycosyltransferase [Candidatus Saccharimonadales bacterium]|nr:glycosyltransferase [Candidatus Saccharimonadales bacterium]
MSDKSDPKPQDSGYSKAQVELLAQQLADSRRQTIETQHRINEIENGRVFRSIGFIKKSLVNPLWAIRNGKQFFGLFRKVEVSPVPDSLPTARDFLRDSGMISLPPSLKFIPRQLKYPHIKIASIGDPQEFAKVAHTFMVDKSDWSELVKLGIDFLLITDHEMAASAYGQSTIKEFRRAKGGRALKDNSTRVLWRLSRLDELNPSLVEAQDIVIITDPTTKPKTAANIFKFAPSVDIETHNPVNWLNRPELNLLAVGHQKQAGQAVNFAKQIVPEFKKKQFIALDGSGSDSLFAKCKSARAVVCRSDFFDNEVEFIQTVLQLVASGVPLIVNPSPTLKTQLGRAYAFTETAKESAAHYNELNDPLYRERYSIKHRQHVLQNHSHLARFESLLDELEIPTASQEMISIIMSTMRQKEVEHGIKNVAAQRWQNKELVLILHRIKEADFDLKKLDSIINKLDFKVTILDRGKDTVFGENLNLALEHASGDFVTKMDDDDYYGSNHLNDLYLAYQYSGATAVGKWANFIYLTGKKAMVDFVTHREERFVRHLPGATVMMRRADLRDLKFGRVTKAIDSELYRRAEMRGGRLYSTHRYNFIRVRHNDHTYDQDEEDFIANASSKPRPGLDKNAAFI